MSQPALITGFFKCDNCGALVDHLRQTRRFRLCDACYERVVPVFPDGRIQPGSPEQKANEAYWEWHGEIDERVPRRREPGYVARTRQSPPSPRPADDYYPLCDCGQPREEYTFALKAGVQTGLFGGPFARECPTCEARRQVEQVMESTTWLHPEWDDEDWLDHLWRVYPDAFALGILPGYWFELRRPNKTAAEDDQQAPP